MENRPQFMKMTVVREENPPPRDVSCPDYRSCLTEAAFRNFCLDCSRVLRRRGPTPASGSRDPTRHGVEKQASGVSPGHGGVLEAQLYLRCESKSRKRRISRLSGFNTPRLGHPPRAAELPVDSPEPGVWILALSSYFQSVILTRRMSDNG
jgi:hypothetical protein